MTVVKVFIPATATVQLSLFRSHFLLRRSHERLALVRGDTPSDLVLIQDVNKR